jgi:hypothetical protein
MKALPRRTRPTTGQSPHNITGSGAGNGKDVQPEAAIFFSSRDFLKEVKARLRVRILARST